MITMRQRQITEEQDIARKIALLSKFVKLEVTNFNYVANGYYFVVDTELNAYKAASYFMLTDKVKVKKPKISPGWRVYIFNLNY